MPSRHEQGLLSPEREIDGAKLPLGGDSDTLESLAY